MGWMTGVKRAETDAGLCEGTTSAEAARIAGLEREVKDSHAGHRRPETCASPPALGRGAADTTRRYEVVR